MGPQSGMLCGFVRPNDSRDDFAGNEIHTIFFSGREKSAPHQRKPVRRRERGRCAALEIRGASGEEMRQTHRRCRRVQDIS